MNTTVKTDTGTGGSAISLPKGGGAIKGIGETFQPNLFSGTGNFSVPIATSSGRSGFGPQLTLQYSSGSGNGPFGLGWQLSIPNVMRKTEKGLPRYTDEDVFVMSGAEDLVPVVDDNGKLQVIPDVAGYAVTRYRPRTEGLFARIERRQNRNTPEDVYWRATTRENVTSIYGKSPSARLSDPNRSDHIFQWLLEETFDAKGNHILYEYLPENPDLDLPGLSEKNRRYCQAYPRRILYGNTPEDLDPGKRAGPVRTGTDHLDSTLTRSRHYLFEVLFDYGDLPEPLPIYTQGSSDLPWWDRGGDDLSALEPRPDPFSSFRSGFEIRTLRLCQRVLMLHHFKEGELVGAPLVKSTDFTYSQDPYAGITLLTEAAVRGYRKDPADPGTYLSRGLPPVTFGYSAFAPEKQRFRSVSAEGGDLPPQALNSPGSALMDIFGDGMADVVLSTLGSFFVWENLGDARLSRRHHPARQLPAGVALDQSGITVGDLGGDGLVDLIVNSPTPGFYEATPEGGWQPFKRIESLPSVDFSDPDLRLLDLTGDGLSDILITRDTHFLWYLAKGEAGYADAARIPRQHDLDAFPDVFFSDPAGRVRLADMSGDGLTDIVLLHDGRIDYWPNLGYGRWGQRLTMENVPRIGFDFDPKRLFLADLDGTGCADLVYVEVDRVDFWFNRSGNGFSEQYTIDGTPFTTDTTALRFADFFGTGTACLVWSYPFGETNGGNYKVLDFCGGEKPHLLVEMSNNLGATTRAQYASSTQFYLEDKKSGRPWITNLPFPVQVLEKSEVIDHIGKTKLVTAYRYHHGYYDGQEREFRGFGRVDQFDTEVFEEFSRPGLHGDEALFQNGQQAFYTPPVETRTWFHTGIYFDPDRHIDHLELTEKYRKEYYQGDAEAVPIGETTFEQADGTAGPGELPREAYRALRGAVLRTEVYGRDGTGKAAHPYSVTESNYQVKELQARHANPRAVYLTSPKEKLTYHYERNPADPRIAQALTLEVDAFGNVLKSASVGYGRRQPDTRLTEEDQARQSQIFITYTENSFTNSITTLDDYHAPLPCEAKTYELTGLDLPPDESRFTPDAMIAAAAGAASIAYEESPTAGVLQKRLIEHMRTLYRPDDIGVSVNDPLVLLPLGTVESLALAGEGYKLAFTPGLLESVYVRGGQKLLPEDPADILGGGGGDRGGYIDLDGDGHFWIPSGRAFFSLDTNDDAATELARARGHFFMPQRHRDPFHTDQFSTESAMTYDDYDLLMVEARDALGNRITVGERKPNGDIDPAMPGNDYRVLQHQRVMDANRNRMAVAFDVLGMVVGSVAMGKPEENLGDSLEGFEADLADDVIQDHLANPLPDPHAILARATTRLVYDLFAYDRTKDQPEPQPPVVYAMARETHDGDLAPGEKTAVQHTFSYSDGFGREIQKKIQAEPGPLDVDDPQAPVVNPRWVGSGWTIFNNKGKPVRQYEPFFSDTHHFEFGVAVGVSPVLFYDPAERVVATLHPNHTWQKVIFDPWRQETWDVNDTALIADPKADLDVGDFFGRLPEADYLPTWYGLRTDNANAAAFAAQYPDANDRTNETRAAHKTELHAATPSMAHADSLGRTFLTVVHNKFKFSNSPQADPPQVEFYATRLYLDIEGNQREVIDAEDRIVMRYDYDLLGHRIHQASMEAGERWMLKDVTGKPLFAWDSRDHRFRTIYDTLRRPIGAYLQDGSVTELLIGRSVYGESQANPEISNLRGKVFQVYDQAGLVTTDEYDFKSNLKRSARTVAQDYKKTYDWQSDSVQASWESYASSTEYDALNRPTAVTAPDQSIYRPVFNEANLLEKVDVNLRGAATAIRFVKNIDYDAKGQRILIEYGNNTNTRYEYNPDTLRLTRLNTLRGTDNADLQDLHYSYDPTGNITFIRDAAQQTLFFKNQIVEPSTDYLYDAIYRLIEAKGREHLGQAGSAPIPHSYNDVPRIGLPQPGDGNAMGNYLERYRYDAVGNFLEFQHRGTHPANPGWTRSYAYNEASLLETGKQSNRLSSTKVGNGGAITELYAYDLQGNMLMMPHLQSMQWDFHDQLQMSRRQAVNAGDADGVQHQGERTWYVYDGTGQRVRKVTERQNGTRMKARIYVGGFEVYREFSGDGVSETLRRESLHVMDDKERIALIETQTIGTASPGALHPPAIRFQIGNHLGSASLELDDTGRIISYEEYFPYGSTSYQEGRSMAEVSLKRYRYTGMERDEESGLSYHGARYYPSWLARWISVDPASFVDGPNLYTYVQNNPVNMRDPSGRQSKPKSQKEVAFKGKPVTGKETPKELHAMLRKLGWDFEGTPKWNKKRQMWDFGIVHQIAKHRGGLVEPGNVGKGTDVGTSVSETGISPGRGTNPGGKPRGISGENAGRKESGTNKGSEKEEGSGNGLSSILRNIAALASLIFDPESLYNAKQSGNKGTGSALGRKNGIISGWMAQILTIAIVAISISWEKVESFFKKIGKGFKSVRNKLFGSVERELITGRQEALIRTFGQGPDEAEAILDRLQERLQAGEAIELPQGVTEEMLLDYEAISRAKSASTSELRKGYANVLGKPDLNETDNLRQGIIDIYLGRTKK